MGLSLQARRFADQWRLMVFGGMGKFSGSREEIDNWRLVTGDCGKREDAELRYAEGAEFRELEFAQIEMSVAEVAARFCG